MKRNNRMLIFFAALAITFGSLFAFAGKDNFNLRRFHRQHGWYDGNNCSDDWRKGPADSLGKYQ